MRKTGNWFAVAAFVLTMGLIASEAQASVEVEFMRTKANKAAGLPFSDAVRVGNLIFLSGQLGVKPGTFDLVEGGIEAEARQTMENIRASLTLAGVDFSDVVKCTVFLADTAEWGTFNKVYVTYFDENPPARSALGANGLALNARVEVECIAVKS